MTDDMMPDSANFPNHSAVGTKVSKVVCVLLYN